MIRYIFFKTLFWSGLGPLLIFLSQRKRQIPVFLFHRVNPISDPFTEPIPPHKFEKIIAFVKKFYRIEETTSISNKSLKGNEAFVQFDDSTQDFYKFAFPILKKYNVPTTLFIPTKSVDENKTIWNYSLFGQILGSKLTKFVLDVDEGIQIEIDKNSKGYYRQVMQLHNLLLHKPLDETIRFLDRAFPTKLDSGFAQLCNWTELLEMKTTSSILSFGSHSLNHCYLTEQPQSRVAEELIGSKAKIEEKLNVACSFVAYPNGGYNEKVISIARNHYTLGFSVDETFIDASGIENGDYQWRLPRFNIQDQTPEEVIFRMYGFHRFVNTIKKQITG